MADGWTYRLRYGDKSLELTEGKMTVGRSRHCDLSIQEPSISRKHVFLTVAAGKIEAQDLGSSNGTFINEDQAVGESALRDSDVLRLGNAKLRVEITTGGRHAAVPLPSTTGPRPDTGDTAPANAELIKDWLAEDGPAEDGPAEDGPPIQPKPSVSLGATQPGTGALAADSGALPPRPADDPDLVPTKRVDSAPIDFQVLQSKRAGLWPRLGAILADGLWAAGLFGVGRELGGDLWGALVALAVFLVVTWLGWAVWGTTPGKRLLRLYVFTVDAEEPGRPGTGLVVSAVRVAGCLLSVLPLGLGFLAVAFSPSRLALHDRLAGTFVLRMDD